MQILVRNNSGKTLILEVESSEGVQAAERAIMGMAASAVDEGGESTSSVFVSAKDLVTLLTFPREPNADDPNPSESTTNNNNTIPRLSLLEKITNPLLSLLLLPTSPETQDYYLSLTDEEKMDRSQMEYNVSMGCYVDAILLLYKIRKTPLPKPHKILIENSNILTPNQRKFLALLANGEVNPSILPDSRTFDGLFADVGGSKVDHTDFDQVMAFFLGKEVVGTIFSNMSTVASLSSVIQPAATASLTAALAGVDSALRAIGVNLPPEFNLLGSRDCV